MAHPEQMEFCLKVKRRHSKYFKSVNVLDIGSLDINGNNRYLFTGYGSYTGIDVGEGRNVDVVIRGHEYDTPFRFDTIISTECFEHDMHWQDTIMNAVRLLKSEGLLLFTCATEGRNEHGTTRTTPQDSPFTYSLFNDYYMNLTEADIRSIPGFIDSFTTYKFSTNMNTKDLYFFGIKK